MTAARWPAKLDDLHELTGEQLAVVGDALVLAAFTQIEALCARPARHSPERMAAIADALLCLDPGELGGAA